MTAYRCKLRIDSESQKEKLKMLTVGIIMMIVGFLGVMVCMKIQRSNPSIQPVALLCVLVLLGGLGVYAYDILSGNSGGSGMETGRIYYCSVADRAGSVLKKSVPGKKVVYVVDPMMLNSETAKSAVETFKKAYGSDDVVLASIEVPADYAEGGMDLFSFLKPKHIDDLVAANSDAGAFVLDIGLPEKGAQVKCFSMPADKRPVFFLTNIGPISGKVVKKLIKDEKISGVVIGKGGKRDPDYEPSAKKLGEAFDRLYVVVDKTNLDKYDKNF